MAESLQLAYRYRLYPTKAQETALAGTLETCRQVYNSLLNWRKHDYEVRGKSPSKFEQQAVQVRATGRLPQVEEQVEEVALRTVRGVQPGSPERRRAR